MVEPWEFFVSYDGELKSEDREALTQPDWKLYENGIGITPVFRDDEMPPVNWRQYVRLRARDDDEAKRLIVEALGYEPPGLRASEGKPPET